jgi:hypothetical protein
LQRKISQRRKIIQHQIWLSLISFWTPP